MMELFNGALTLNQTVMRGLREAPDAVRRGFLLILFVGLLVGTANGISELIQSATPERAAQTLHTQLDRQMDQLVRNSNDPTAQTLIRLVNENEESFFALFTQVNTLPTALPRPVGQLFHLLAAMISTPLSYLAGTLVAVIVTHITARQLGGQGSLQQMLGLGSLSVAPHALDALSFIPGLGQMLGLVAWTWGLVVLIQATVVAHRLDSRRSTIAVLLYPLLFGVLGFLGFCMLLGILTALASGARP